MADITSRSQDSCLLSPTLLNPELRAATNSWSERQHQKAPVASLQAWRGQFNPVRPAFPEHSCWTCKSSSQRVFMPSPNHSRMPRYSVFTRHNIRKRGFPPGHSRHSSRWRSPVHWQGVRQHAGLYPPALTRTQSPNCDNPKCLKDIAKCPLRGTLTPD